MSDQKLKFALIGPGAIATHHILAIQQIENAEITYICGIEKEITKNFAEKFQIPWSTELKAVLANKEVDAVIATVPSGLHADIGIQAAQAGKHVIVEKPIDVTLEKADELVNACKNAGTTLGVISQNRYLDSVLKAKELITSGKLGELVQGDAYIKWYRSEAYYQSGAWRGTWKLDGGGPFINQGIHFIDLLLSVMGPVKWVSGKTKTITHDIEVEDTGMAMLEFVNGAYGVIQASTATYPGLPARLEIHGTKGTIIIEGEKIAFMQIEGQEPYKESDVAKGGASDPLAINVTPFVREYKDFIEAVREKREPQVNGAEARRSLELILAIYESSKTGKPIQLN